MAGPGFTKNNPYVGLISSYSKGVPTAASLLGTARKAVAAELAPTITGLQKDSGLLQRQYSNQATRAQGFAEALARLNMNQSRNLANEYGDTARFLGTLGTGLTGAVAEDWAAKTQAAQQAVDQMTGGLQGATVNPGYSQPGLASTAQYTGVTLPAADLAQQALNAGQMLRAQSAADVAGVGTIAQEYLSKLGDARAQLAADIAKTRGQRPALVEKALEGLRTGREEKLSNLTKLLGGATDWETTQREMALKASQEAREAASAKVYDQYLKDQIGLRTDQQEWEQAYEDRKLTIDQQVEAQNIAIRWANAQTAADRAAAYTQAQRAGLWLNPDTGRLQKLPAGMIIGKDGKLRPVPGKGTDRATPRANELTNLRTSMTDAIKAELNYGKANPFQPEKKWSHAQVAKWLMGSYGQDFLIAYPGQRKAIQRMVNTIATAIAGAPKGPTGAGRGGGTYDPTLPPGMSYELFPDQFANIWK